MFIGACLALLAMLVASPVHAAEPSCATPRAAVATHLDWLQPERYDPDVAARCLDVAPDQARRAGQVAVQLKQVLDARGLYVPVDELPDEPEWADADGRARLVPLSSFPRVVLERVDGEWRYSRATVNAVPELYRDTFSQVSLAFQRILPSVFFERVGGVHYWQLLYAGLLVFVAVAAGRLLHMFVARQILGAGRRFRLPLEKALADRIRGPVTLAVTSAILLWGIPDLQLGVRTSGALLFFTRVLLSIAAVAVAYRTVDVVEGVFARRAARTAGKLDDQLVPLVGRSAKVAVVMLGVVFVLQNQGVDVASLLAGLGLGGLAFALAAKDTVENLFGSVTLFVDRPFQIGDWVIIDGKVEGVVEEVGLRSTRVRTFAKSLVSVPNGKVATSTINNMGQRPIRRITTTIGVTYDTPRDRLEAYVARLNAIIREHPETWKETVEIHFNDFGPSSLDVMIYFFVDVPDWHRELQVRQEILLSFIRAAEELGIAFAFPSTSLYVERLPAGGRAHRWLPPEPASVPPELDRAG